MAEETMGEKEINLYQPKIQTVLDLKSDFWEVWTQTGTNRCFAPNILPTKVNFKRAAHGFLVKTHAGEKHKHINSHGQLYLWVQMFSL